VIAAVFLLVASAAVGFGARAGWFASEPGSSSAAQATPDSSRTASSPDANGAGVDLGSVAEDVEDAIVNITSATDRGVGAGTGMIISSNGLVLTNHHVISGARDLEVEVGGDGDTYDAHVVGYTIDDDVALVQIEDASDLPTIATERDVLADDDVLVMGNALGRGGEPTVSAGRVVALGQQITATDDSGGNAETLTDMIRIEASVQPGQSGGAVVNADGEVVGMTTAASTNGGFRLGFDESSGEAFAIPIARALSAVDEIKDGESNDSVHVGPRAVLGVEIQQQLFSPGGRRVPVPDATGDGVAVSGIQEDGPAADAGISAGSTILAIGDTTVSSSDDITRAMNTLRPDDEVKVTWLDPQGERHTASIELDEGPPL
jgi:S1-C subfamily serine protease